MAWRKNIVDASLFVLIVIGGYSLLNNNATFAIISLICALGISIFRRAIYDLLG